MNRKNPYCNDNDLLDVRLFFKVQHSSLINRTKTALDDPNIELIKSDSLPVPIITTKHSHKINDPVQEFIDIKNEYEYEKKILETRLTRSYRIGKIVRDNGIIKKNFKEYVTRKFLDPVPYMNKSDCFYFYPHHGTLKCFETENDDYLVTVSDDDKFHFNQIHQKMPFQGIISSSVQTHPLELIINDTSNFVAARYRNKIKFARLPDTFEDGKVIEKINEFEFKNDILASSLNDVNLSTIDSKYRLKRLNIEYRYEDVNINLSDYFFDDYLLPFTLGTPIDNKLKSNVASFTTRYNFGIIDFRNKKKLALINHFKSSKDLVLRCEKICSHVNSQLSNNLVYIASSHLLYTYDYRNLKEPIVYWTHQLYDPPMMLSTTMHGLNEVVCASSNMVGDLKLFNNNGKSVNYYPYKPQSIKSSYNNLREQGLFLLSENIQERVKGSITGIALHSDNKRSRIKLFTQNCYGDVYQNVLKCKEGTKNDIRSTIENFQLWENHLKVPFNPNMKLTAEERVRNEDFVVDNIAKLESLSKFLSDEKSNAVVDLTNLDPEEVLNYTVNWKVNIGDARQCTDLLAKEIMYLWSDVDDNEDEDWEKIDLIQETKGKDKVSQWLESTNVQMEEDNEMEDEFSPNMTSTQAVSSAPTTSVARRKSRIVGF